jgi:hypothetical protein
MNPPSAPANILKNASRLIGWSFLLGGLALSLLADSLTGLGALRDALQGFGFPAGTICVGGFLLLAIASVGTRETTKQPTPDNASFKGPTKERPSKPGGSEIRNLEDRLIAELDRRHEGIKEDLQNMSALLEANLESSAENLTDWPLAVGAEFSGHQLRPAPRRLGPQPHHTEPLMEEELEMTLEIEEQAPDETRLWTQRTELSELGDLEDRLSGDVSIEPHDFVWDFPIPDSQAPGEEQTDRAQEAPAEVSPDTSADYAPPVDPENIAWLDWDEEDLV